MADTLPSILVTDTPSPGDRLRAASMDPLSSKDDTDGGRDDRVKSSSSNECKYGQRDETMEAAAISCSATDVKTKQDHCQAARAFQPN